MARVLVSTVEKIKAYVSEELEPLSQLPNEQELAEMTGVSRATVREAVARLEADGLITKVWGVGTFVADPPAPVGVSFLSIEGGIPAGLGAAGGEVSILRFESSVQEPDPVSFPDFEDIPTVSSLRVFGLDGVPAVVLRDLIVGVNEGKVLDLSDLHSVEGLVPNALRRIGLELDRIELDLRGANLDRSQQLMLGIDGAEPYIEATGVGYDPAGRPILITTATHRTNVVRLHVAAT